MIPTNELTGLAGKSIAGADGHKIGKIVDVYESTDGSDGTFVTVHTGLFGGHASFVPLREAALQGGEIVVPYAKDQVKDAPGSPPTRSSPARRSSGSTSTTSSATGIRQTARHRLGPRSRVARIARTSTATACTTTSRTPRSAATPQG